MTLRKGASGVVELSTYTFSDVVKKRWPSVLTSLYEDTSTISAVTMPVPN